MNPTLLFNSVGVALVATVLSLVAGVAAALVATAYPAWRRTVLVSGVLCLALPPFLPANAWLEVTAGPRASGAPEWVAVWTLPFVAFVLASGLWPISLFLTLSGWSRLQPGHLEAAVGGAGWNALRRVMLPGIATELRVAATITLALSLANFTVPTLFQVRVFTEEFWIRFNTQFDLPGAIAGSWPLLLLPPLVLVWIARHPVSWIRQTASLDSRVVRSVIGAWGTAALVFTAIWIALSLLFPLVQLATSPRTWSELSGAVAAGGSALRQSVMTAAAAATAIVGVGLLLTRSHLHRQPVVKSVRVLGWILFLLPGVFEGVLLLHAFTLDWLRPLSLGAGGIILAVTLRYAVPAWLILSEAARTLDRDQTDAARSSGASAWTVFRSVEWRQMRIPVFAAWYAVYLLALWDVETVVLIQPPGGETLALRVFNLLHYGHGTQVNALCVVLLGLALLPGVLVGLAGSLRRWTGGNGRLGMSGWIGLLAVGLMAGGCGESSTGSGALESDARAGLGPEQPLKSQTFRAVQVLGSRGVAPGQFNKPRSLVCDRDDNLFVADMTGRIQKFDAQGRWVLQWQMPQTDLGKPKGMCLDPEGHVVVVEPHYQRVNVFSTEGKLIRQWGVKGTAPGELILPRSIVCAPDGRFFLTEYTVVDRLQRFSAAGKFERTWGAPGGEPGRFNRAEGICMDAAGRLLVADSCNHRIQVFTADGDFVRTYGTAGAEPGKLSYPYDIRVDAQGRQFICEFGNSRVSVFGAKDELIEVVGGAGAGPGQFANPWAIAFDSHGSLYVADSQNHRVQKLIARGAVAGRGLAATPAVAASGPRS